MNDTPWRRDSIGASDTPAILGMDPFRTAGDAWAEFTGRLPVVPDDTDAVTARELGSTLTPFLVGVAARRLGRSLAPEVFYQHPAAPLSCTVDAIALQEPAVLVEAKTAGLLGGRSPLLDGYGHEATDEVPDSVMVQVHHAFGVLDAQPNVPRVQRALVVALLGGRGIKCFDIERSDELVAAILDEETDWWGKYVVRDRCPPRDPPSLPTLKRMLRRKDALARSINGTFVREWQDAKAILKQAQKNEETLRALVINELGDGEVGVCAEGRVTYFETTRSAYTVAASTSRTLRFTEARERKVA